MVNCPKHPTANKTRMNKPLADNFRNLNYDITFLNNSQTIYYMVYLY